MLTRSALSLASTCDLSQWAPAGASLPILRAGCGSPPRTLHRVDVATERIWSSSSPWRPADDPYTGSPLEEPIAGHDGPVTSVVFAYLSNGDVRLATAGDDATVQLWNPYSGVSIQAPILGHKNVVSGLAFGKLSGECSRLTSASWDGEVRLWDAATGAGVGPPLTGHDGRVTAVAFGLREDGRIVWPRVATTRRCEFGIRTMGDEA